MALTSQLHDDLTRHLLRRDRQEDVCFAVWHPSGGSERVPALLSGLVLPEPGDRNVHGNASFTRSMLSEQLVRPQPQAAGSPSCTVTAGQGGKA